MKQVIKGNSSKKWHIPVEKDTDVTLCNINFAGVYLKKNVMEYPKDTCKTCACYEKQI